MQIDILGTVTVTVDGERRSIGSHKVRALLATLALDVGRAISHGELADELWAGHSLGNARNAMQAHATRLRKVIDTPGRESRLRAMRGGYLLDTAPESVDANRFLDLAERGAAEVRTDPDRAIALLREALRLWRGPALLDAGDGLRCRGAAALFDERRLTVWEDLTAAWLLVGRERDAVAELTQLVEQHPLRERFCELLMLALYRSGRQCEALELFRRTRSWLGGELGLEPSAPLRRLHSEILAQEPGLLLPSALWPDVRSLAVVR
ncbi:AfsR/SARP family transcriptional regulator [Actinokineospora bangkokensis]|uniref:SARP family transcriptional regulator n=1 Tax=Actinokineospora bangkokensis TaxID=1193682 RepID=A0A1Q9LQ18_9PSEU|nr:AfsR/SARP family transcriptional regulator [Actinokineospora bangkokensis]OLR94120.1 SARP family transcriptional regulator [Actinokineospora bangkokensis]